MADVVVAQRNARPPLVVVSAEDLLLTEFPPRRELLSWLVSQSLNMVYSWRGTGKTWFLMNVAVAAAGGGSFLHWSAPKPINVLYLDGEMPGVSLQERLAMVVASAEREPPPGNLRILTPDLNRDRFLPDLSTYSGQEEIADIAGDAELIIVDNLSCLARSGGKENEAESWQIVADWALQQRANGRSVLFAHHAGKGGQQRGTSKREDILDTVISLRRPNDYDSREGARFEVHFEKARGLHGDQVNPIEAKLEAAPNGGCNWSWRKVEDALTDQITVLYADGLTQRQIAQELEVGLATVNRHLKKAQS